MNQVQQFGGGIASFGTLTISNATFTGNDAGLDEGGMSNGSGAILNATNDTFHEINAVRDGGAIFDEGTEHITNTTMTDNTAGEAGAGFFEEGGEHETTTNDFIEEGGEVTGSGSFTVLAAGIGGSPLVQVRDNSTGEITLSFLAYDSSFKGGVQATQGWVSVAEGMAVNDIITAPVSGNIGEIRIFDAQTGDLIRSIAALPEWGASVAMGDLNGDGLDVIVVGAAVAYYRKSPSTTDRTARGRRNCRRLPRTSPAE